MERSHTFELWQEIENTAVAFEKAKKFALRHYQKPLRIVLEKHPVLCVDYKEEDSWRYNFIIIEED